MKGISAQKFILMATSALLSGAIGMSSAAMAQAAPQPSPANSEPQGAVNSGGLEDIVVTARRTSENLQTTPVAVTSVSSAALETKQILQTVDLQRAAPAVSVGTGGTGPASIIYISIRGEAQNSPNSFSDNAVGVYIDGVYLARPIGGNVGFLDLDSAEVLRGPQGTLFGRNTIGGALNITTKAPTHDFEGYIKAGYGNYSDKTLEGVVNIPLSSQVAVRFAGKYREHDAYYPDPYREGFMRLYGDYMGRGSLKWTPDALPLTWTVSGDYATSRDSGSAFAVAAVNPFSPLAYYYDLAQRQQGNPAIIGAENDAILTGALGFPVPSFDVRGFLFNNNGRPITQYVNSAFPNNGGLLSNNPFSAYGAHQFGYDLIDNPRQGDFSWVWSATSNLVVDIGDVKIKSITGYRKSTASNNFNLSGTPTGGGAAWSQYNNHQFSEELQVLGSLGKLQYIAGAIYFREAGDETSRARTFFGTPIQGDINNFGEYISKSAGLFAQVNYSFTDRLRATAGIRYTWDTRIVNRHNTNSFLLPPAQQTCFVGPNANVPNTGDQCNDPQSARFHYPAWTAGLDYKLTDAVFIYAKTSGASMSGGFNSRPVAPGYSDSFKPEKVRDVEAGFKGEFLDRHLRTNLAAFYSWESDVQRIVNTVVCDPNTSRCATTQFVNNAGKVNTYGAEFEGTLIPWEGMTIDTSAAYLHAAYVKGSRTENQLVNGGIVPVDRTGEPVPYSPKWTFSVGATQDFPLGSSTLSAHLDYAYIADRAFDSFTSADPAQQAAVAIANKASIIKAYGLVNGALTWKTGKKGIELTGWVRNLTNKAYFTNIFNSYTGIGATVQNQGVPRTYGVTAQFSW